MYAQRLRMFHYFDNETCTFCEANLSRLMPCLVLFQADAGQFVSLSECFVCLFVCVPTDL